MKMWHGVIILIIGYFIGSYFGSYGKQAVSAVTNAVS